MKQPWDIFWQAQAYTRQGRAAVGGPRDDRDGAPAQGDHRHQHRGPEARSIEAVDDLKQLYSICNIKVGDTQYQTIPEGTRWLNQAWSGDLIAAYFYYLPKGTPASVMSYWKAPNGHVPVQNDCCSICTTTKKPVLVAPWLNYMLDNGVAYSNFVNFNGYQPPLNEHRPRHRTRRSRRRRDPREPPDGGPAQGGLRPELAPGDDADRQRPARSGRTATRTSRPGLGRMYPRWLWRDSRFPGVIWLILLFIMPFYAVIGGGVRHGRPDPLHAPSRSGTRSSGTSAG